MVLNRIAFILCSLTIFAFYGCGHQALNIAKKSNYDVASVEGLDKINNEVSSQDLIDKAVKKLDKLTEQALAKDPGTIDFLASDLYIKAADSSIRGDAYTAAFLFKYVVKLKPNDDYVKKRYAIELIRTEKLEESAILLNEIFKKNKNDESVGLILGGVFTAQKKYKKAQNIYSEIIKHNPKSEEGCVFLAKAHIRNNLYFKARRQLNVCEKKMPKAAIFSYYKGKMALERGDKKTARTDFLKVLKIDSAYYQGALGLGLLLEEKENYKGAAAVYRKFLKQHPNNYSVLTRMVQILFVLAEHEEIIPYAETLSSLDPSDLDLKVRLGILYTDAKKYAEAKEIFKSLLKAVPNSDKVLYYLGALHQQTNDFLAAINFFNKVPPSSALFHDSNIQIAQILNRLAMRDNEMGQQSGEDKLVSFVAEKGKIQRQLNIELNIILGGFYESRLDFSKALAAVGSVAGLKGFNEGHQYYFASLMEKNGDYKGARTIVFKMLQENPDNAHALNFLGYSYLEKNEKLPLAYKYISKAVGLKPNDGFIRDSMGWYYYKIGELEKALVETKKAWKLVKSDPVIARHLAIIYRDLNKHGMAKKYLVEALKHCKQESEKKEVLKALQELDQRRIPASAK